MTMHVWVFPDSLACQVPVRFVSGLLDQWGLQDSRACSAM